MGLPATVLPTIYTFPLRCAEEKYRLPLPRDSAGRNTEKVAMMSQERAEAVESYAGTLLGFGA